jgi:hypothetical protein
MVIEAHQQLSIGIADEKRFACTGDQHFERLRRQGQFRSSGSRATAAAGFAPSAAGFAPPLVSCRPLLSQRWSAARTVPQPAL